MECVWTCDEKGEEQEVSILVDMKVAGWRLVRKCK